MAASAEASRGSEAGAGTGLGPSTECSVPSSVKLSMRQVPDALLPPPAYSSTATVPARPGRSNRPPCEVNAVAAVPDATAVPATDNCHDSGPEDEAFSSNEKPARSSTKPLSIKRSNARLLPAPSKPLAASARPGLPAKSVSVAPPSDQAPPLTNGAVRAGAF